MGQEQEDRERPREPGDEEARSAETPARRGEAADAARATFHTGRSETGLVALQEEETGERRRREHGRLDHRHRNVAVQSREQDLCRQHAKRPAEDVGSGERGERGEERQERRARERRTQERERHAAERARRSGAERRGRLEICGVEARETGPREEIKVDVHRVRVDEEDRARAGKPPRGFVQPEGPLDRARDEAALAVKEEKRHDANERRKHHWQRDHRAEHPPAREFGALEEECERNADRRSEADRRERDPEARPERAPFVGAADERGEVGERPGGCAERLAERDRERITDEPDEEEGEDRRGGVPPAEPHAGLR